MTTGRVYTATFFYIAAAVFGWKAAQFATVTVLQTFSTGYGFVWAILSVQLIIGGFLGALYFMFLGRDTGRRDLAGAGAALTATVVTGCAWLIMDVALL